MKNRIHLGFTIISLAALLPVAALAAEKQSSGKAVVSLSELKSQLSALQTHISSTMAALEGVKVSAETGGLEKAAANFSTRFQTLDAQVERIRRDAVVVKARAADHYEHWQKEIAEVQNPKIREKAQARFASARQMFDKIIASAQETKQQSVPFLSDLKDIATYLEADLSQDAVKSLSSTIWKLGNKSKGVLGSISDLNEQIDRAIKAMPKNA